MPKKTQRGGPLVSPVLLEALKNLWFSARIEPTHSGWVEDGRWTNMKDEQIVRKVDHSEWDCQLKKKQTRRERPKSAPYLRLKNIQGTTVGNIWKNYFFQKKIEIFFRKKSIFLESRTMPKNSKRGHSGSLNVFTNRKLQKKCNW